MRGEVRNPCSLRNCNFLDKVVCKSQGHGSLGVRAEGGEDLCSLHWPVALATLPRVVLQKKVSSFCIVVAGCSVVQAVWSLSQPSLLAPPFFIHADSPVSLEGQFCSLKSTMVCFSLTSSEFFQARQLGKPGLRNCFTGFWPSHTDQNSHQKGCLHRVKFLLGKCHSGGPRKP